MINKDTPLESKVLRASAKGSPCTLNIANVCEDNRESTVLCHIYFGNRGTGTKADDFQAVYGCCSCHQHMDQNKLSKDEYFFYAGRGIARTHQIIRDNGVMAKVLEEIERNKAKSAKHYAKKWGSSKIAPRRVSK